MSAFGTLQSLIIGFLDAALWTEHDESTEAGGEPFDANYGWEDLAPDTIHAACLDCAEFLDRCREQKIDNFGALIERPSVDSASSAGHDFLLTRNGHGAGFWDGDWAAPAGAALSEIAHSFGDFSLYLGDDGLIYAENF